MQFNWDWEYRNKELLNSIPFVKNLIYIESLYFHPDPQEQKAEQSPVKVAHPNLKTPTAVRELLQTVVYSNTLQETCKSEADEVEPFSTHPKRERAGSEDD